MVTTVYHEESKKQRSDPILTAILTILIDPILIL